LKGELISLDRSSFRHFSHLTRE